MHNAKSFAGRKESSACALLVVVLWNRDSETT